MYIQSVVCFFLGILSVASSTVNDRLWKAVGREHLASRWVSVISATMLQWRYCDGHANRWHAPTDIAPTMHSAARSLFLRRRPCFNYHTSRLSPPSAWAELRALREQAKNAARAAQCGINGQGRQWQNKMMPLSFFYSFQYWRMFHNVPMSIAERIIYLRTPRHQCRRKF